MLLEPKLNLLNDLVSSSSKEELIWMNGYLSGLLAQRANSLENRIPETSVVAIKRITVVYGTETGNAKKIATDFATHSKKSGVNAKLISLDQYKLNDLSKEEFLFIVISTQGDGEPPIAAKKFYDFIHQEDVDLSKLKYAILALGDSSYPLYCKAGEDVYLRLQHLGATALLPLEKSDVDYSNVSTAWFKNVLNVLSNQHTSKPIDMATTAIPKTGKQYYKGVVQQIINLKDNQSSKKTYHIELAVNDSNIFQVGDSLGIIPHNSIQLVKEIIHLLELNPDQTIHYRNEDFSIVEFLSKKANIVYLSTRVIRQYAQLTNQEIPATRMGLLELLKIYPSSDRFIYQDFVKVLEPNAPRLYSISSSPLAQEGEIHLTVALDIFNVNGETKTGLCSSELCEWEINQEVEFYIQPNHHFKLPPDESPIIMIGPGTGIAPFRAFLWERDARGANGKNWLFFGEQHFVSDFLYQTEIQNWYQTGLLTEVSVAFSQDQNYKIYVQHKILERAKDFWKWIQDGASIYICGSRDPMSKDVLYTIQTVIERFGGKSTIDAKLYLDELQSNGKILLDVY